MVAEDDDVDMQSLQAQIDMSMSSDVNALQMFEDGLHRPPRLGVGAAIPAAPPLAHEASKLKRKLGKNEARSERVVESQLRDPSKSDDEEQKGRATKRKKKTDPFGPEGNKKKRKSSASRALTKHDSFSRQERQRMGPGDQQSHAPEVQRLATSVSSLPVALLAQTTFLPSLNAPAVPSLSEPSLKPSEGPVSGKPTMPESSQKHAKHISIPDKAKPLGIPLLNLDGPPELTDKPGNTSELNKKKRKKHKKKKNQMIAGTEDK